MSFTVAGLLTSAGIGSMIGGFTNQLAITMLFRPYHPLTVLVQHLESMVHGLLTSLYARPLKEIIRETLGNTRA